MYSDYVNTPIGILKVVASENSIQEIEFVSGAETNHTSNQLTDEACFQLKQYFDGRLTQFDLPLKPLGTPFQGTVWQQLKEIPFGKTSTYGNIAKALGDPNKVRAVGNANGQNPIAIVIPCHRVIGSSGQLVGYAGGLHRKQWLLDFESQITSKQMNLF